MIYECPQGHICFSKDNLDVCGMKGCGTCTRVYFEPIKYLNLKDEIENDAFMITSDAFGAAVSRAFGPLRSEDK
jgi:hypothetical protein